MTLNATFLPEQPNFILVDGSYYIFYRYYAMLNWFKLAKKDETLGNPIENEFFLEKFKSTFIDKLKNIPKKLKIKNPIMLVGRDCPRKTIWRMKHLPTYKANRVYDDTFLGGPFFKMAYNDKLFTEGGSKIILSYPELEADDCIAITAKNILTKFPKANITIITSDMDYLQLANSQITLYDLKFKKLTERKSSYDDAEKDLFVKMVTGDKSDNIPSIFKKCGPKTACKYYDNKELFHKKLEQEGAKEKYELNRKMIDFNMIPMELIEGFKNKYNIS